MSYTHDALASATYNLTSGGIDLGGTYTLTAITGGGWRRDGSTPLRTLFGGTSWCVQRQITVPSSPAAACILEYAGWGEDEGENIQLLVGWDSSLRPYIGWEDGAGQDTLVRANYVLPPGDVDLAFEREAGIVRIYVNGTVVLEASGASLPSGGTLSNVELRVGRRITDPDDELAPTGGWLRFGAARGTKAIRDEWMAAHALPVYSPTTWDALAHQPNTEQYFVFRGTFASGAAVRWGTRGVHHPTGFIEPRLKQAPTGIVRGVPDSIGAAPERASATLTLVNKDRALDTLWIGGTTAADEYTGDSFRNLTGKLYLGIVSAAGTVAEQAITPTLCLAGDATSGEGEITIPLGSRDEDTLGASRRMVTVEELLAADVVDHGDLTSDEWNRIISKRPAEIDTTQIVGWGYGRPTMPLVHVGMGQSRRTWFWCVSIDEPTLADDDDWSLLREGKRPSLLSSVAGDVWKIHLEVAANEQHDALDLWLVGYHSSNMGEEFDDWYLAPPADALIGMTVTSMLASRTTPGHCYRKLVIDHAEAGAAAVDESSFVRASTAESGLCGISYRTDVPISEVLSHAATFGLAFAMKTDDTVMAVPTGWTPEDIDEAAGVLPEIRLDEITEGTFEEIIPVGNNVRGSAATVIMIEWPQEMRDIWPAETLVGRGLGANRDLLGQDHEARVSGSHIYPPLAKTALAMTAARRDFAARRIRVGVNSPWPAALELGQLMRITHPFGSPGGYSRRLVRLERIEVNGTDFVCRLTLEDLGRYEAIKVGRLDSLTNWLLYKGSSFTATLTATAGSKLVNASAPIFDSTWEERSFWTPAAPDEEDRARRVYKVNTSTQLEVDRSYVSNWTLVLSGGPAPADVLDEDLLVLENETTKGISFRPDKIRAADEETGGYPDGATGFRMMMR